MLDKQVVFKTNAFGGFDKKAVLDYVYTLNQRAEEAQARLEEHINSLAIERDELALKLENAKSEIFALKNNQSSVQEELEGERRRIAELNELVSALNEELQRQKDTVEEKDRAIREYTRLSAEYSKKIDGLEKTRAEVDHASAQIGKLLIEAHADADKVRDNAHRNAGDIVAGAKTKADEILSDAEVQAKRVIAEAGQEAKLKTESAQRAVDLAYEKFSVFRSEISSLQKVILDSLEDIHFKAGTINEAINDAQNTIHDAGRAPVYSVERGLSGCEDALDPEDERDGPFFRYAAEE